MFQSYVKYMSYGRHAHTYTGEWQGMSQFCLKFNWIQCVHVRRVCTMLPVFLVPLAYRRRSLVKRDEMKLLVFC